MPDDNAATGDVYQVYRNVTTAPRTFGEKRKRPCVCADPGAQETTWTGVSRLTNGIHSSDLPSKAITAIGLDKDGAWSTRFIHSVYKTKTGGPACEFMGELPPEVLDKLVEKYPRVFVVSAPTDSSPPGPPQGP